MIYHKLTTKQLEKVSLEFRSSSAHFHTLQQYLQEKYSVDYYYIAEYESMTAPLCYFKSEKDKTWFLLQL